MNLSHFATGNHAPHRGVYEITLNVAEASEITSVLDIPFRTVFTRPDGTCATADGFYDGDNTFKARAYCDIVGPWRWRSDSGFPALAGRSGAFEVVPSALKGKLRYHPDDPHQFAYDNGDWFLHIGDTGYRYVTATEPAWQTYIDQAARMGATKIRTWFCQGRSDVQILFDATRAGLNLSYWQEIDRRLIYALEHHPHIQFALIPYGEDTGEIRRYDENDPASKRIAQYAQARFSALPNVHWCISNDREIVRDDAQPLEGRQVYARTIDRIGREMAAREPWGTLLTNHQCRGSGYDFVDAPWSDIITLEDLDQVDGALLLDYRRRRAVPVVNDEDRYETYRPPQHPRYFFRRLMWGSLLSGGHATYGGLHTYEPYDGDLKGIQGYYDAVAAGKLEGGARDFVYIHQFFNETGLTLVGMTPDDGLVGDTPSHYTCIHNHDAWIIYAANPSGDVPETDDASRTVPTVAIQLPAGTFSARWFDPATGEWDVVDSIPGGTQTLTAPGDGDWVLLLERARR
jgi:hypothetical protein